MSSEFSPNSIRRNGRENGASVFARGLWRALVAAIVLFAAMAAMFLYRDLPFTLIDGAFAVSRWLSWGMAAIPVSFVVIHLVNRRYGPTVASSVVLLAWIAIVGLVGAQQFGVQLDIPDLSGFFSREGIALVASLMFGQLMAVASFDGMRSIRWWSAPFWGFLLASAAFAFTYYPAAFLGTEREWIAPMLIHFLVLLGGSLVLLIVYWAFRPLIRPLPGFAGY